MRASIIIGGMILMAGPAMAAETNEFGSLTLPGDQKPDESLYARELSLVSPGGIALAQSNEDQTSTAPDFSSQIVSRDRKSDSRFHSGEFSLDTFGGVTLGEYAGQPFGARSFHEARYGGGLGVNYFFHRNIGIEAESFTEGTRHSFVDNTSGSMVFRLPIYHSGLAGYAFGGAGHQFDPVASSSFHTGAGLEYRLNSRVGLFIEPRMVFRTKISNYGFGRCGVRIVF